MGSKKNLYEYPYLEQYKHDDAPANTTVYAFPVATNWLIPDTIYIETTATKEEIQCVWDDYLSAYEEAPNIEEFFNHLNNHYWFRVVEIEEINFFCPDDEEEQQEEL